MALIETELGTALSPPVRRKRNNTGKLRSAAKRIAAHSTEVMVKVTGFGKGAGHIKAHLEYISRNGKVELENDRGERLDGKEEVKAFFRDWEKDFGDSKRHRNQRDSMHLVLSMPETTDAESVHRAARQFAKARFAKNHEYVFALHTDAPHPHCHVTVKCLGFDGTRLNPRKADLQAWREDFAEKLREQGVDAEATPRRARGVILKAERNVVRHIERGDKTHPPRVSRVRAAKVKEAARELSAEAQGSPVPLKPWEEAIQARQREVRRAWLAAAAALEQEDSRLTFNHEEPRNERPPYAQVSAEQARRRQRAAALYQSHLEESGRQAPAGALASVRNLSGLAVVHDERALEVLLHPHARDRVGWERGADSEMRRTRTGDSRARADRQRLEDQRIGTAEGKTLAGRIRAFVAAMPALDTERHHLKRELTQRFVWQAENSDERGRLREPRLSAGQDDGARDRNQGKDIQR